MLVIRRRAGESFQVGEDVEVTILEVAAGTVKVGIAAPRHVAVVRNEILLARRANLDAAAPAGAEDLIRLARQLRGGAGA